MGPVRRFTPEVGFPESQGGRAGLQHALAARARTITCVSMTPP